MAWLQKKVITRYLDRSGNRVTKNTKGARRVSEESDKWYGCWKEGKRKVMIPLATDKTAAQTLLADLLRKKERGEARLLDPFKEHLDRPLSEHIGNYLAVVRTTTRSEQYHQESARVLSLFVRKSSMKLLREVTADRVAAYLSKLTSGPATRNHHRTAIVQFMNWLESVRRIDRSPINKKSVRPAKKGKRRERRALPAEDIAKLLQAVRDYPVQSASVNRGGRNAKKSPQARPCKLRPETATRLRHRGRDRWLMYRLAVLCGLRRGELSRLKVAHLELERQPFAMLNMPGHLTKNGKPARILLVPSLAGDLRQWIIDTGKRPTDPVVTVPNRHNLIKLHKTHLALAGITYIDPEGRCADFHSLRMSANVVLRKAGIPAKERQLFLRHGTLALTTETYDDDAATEMADVVQALTDAKL
ncbi:hypothetical protein AYO44_12300 [Planctomycetaceae bacterium SCGC AG-212-F19]|nr:hypothetical protein AYO44_12300 [Planctomycetaceae bacterium SCGC AG-212-F19]